MTVEVRTTDANGVPVVSLRGVAGPDLLERLADGISAIAENAVGVVIDLDDLVLADALALRAFLARLGRTSACWVVSCSRLSGRRVVRRYGHPDVGVFASPAEAAASFALAS